MLTDFAGADRIIIACGRTDLRLGMSNWFLRASEDCLTPVYEELHRELLKHDVFHADETTLQVLHEPEKKPQTDGYAVYLGLPEGITVVGCHAHLRRRFDEAIKSLSKGKAKDNSAYQCLAYCDLLFAIEKGLDEKNATAEERYQERLEQAKPVLDAMFAWANSRTAAPKSALGKAFTYLKDGRLELSNNRAGTVTLECSRGMSGTSEREEVKELNRKSTEPFW